MGFFWRKKEKAPTGKVNTYNVPTGRVEVTIVYATTKEAVPGVHDVILTKQNESFSATGFGGGGVHVVDKLGPGTYTLQVTLKGEEAKHLKRVYTRSKVKVTRKRTRKITIRVERAALQVAVRWAAELQPISGTHDVTLKGADGETTQTTDTGGRTTFDPVAPGRYSVETTVKGEDTELFVDKEFMRKTTVARGKTTHLSVEVPWAELLTEVRYAGTRVAVPGTHSVRVSADGVAEVERTSDSNGRAKIGRVTSGKPYTFRASVKNDQAPLLTPADPLEQQTTVATSGGADLVSIDVDWALLFVGVYFAGTDDIVPGRHTIKASANGKDATEQNPEGEAAQFGRVSPGDYTLHVDLDAQKAAAFPLKEQDAVLALGSREQTPLKVEVLWGAAEIDVRYAGTEDLLPGAHEIKLVPQFQGAEEVSGTIDGQTNKVKFEPLAPGDYKIEATLKGDDANGFAVKDDTTVTVETEKTVLGHAEVPWGRLEVEIKDPKPDEIVPGAHEIKLTAQTQGVNERTVTVDETEKKGTGQWLPTGKYDLTTTLKGDAAAPFILKEEKVEAEVKESETTSTVIEVVRPRAYLKLQFKTPEDKPHLLPKDFPVHVVYDEADQAKAETVKLKLDDKGVVLDAADKPGFDVLPNKHKEFTLLFPTDKEGYVVCEKAKATDTQEVFYEKTTDVNLKDRLDKGFRVFRVPAAKWTLGTSDWAVDPKGGRADAWDDQKRHFKGLDNKDTGRNDIGSDAEPAELLLDPHWMYVRFEYFDRKYVHSDHGDKRISIPPILLKGVRKCANGNAGGKYDTASNWTTKDDDNAKACQCLPWIVVRDKDDKDLPKLDKSSLLEFACDGGVVVSTSAAERTIEVLPPDDAKRKPSKDRDQYYDLPKLWKSKNYYTRLPGDTGKFFDELEEADFDGSFTVDTPLTFSLDDIVLVTNAGSQAVKDKDRSDAQKDLSKHSRVSLLFLDPTKKHQVQVYEPRDDAVYHSKAEFVKEAAAETRRNVLTDYSPYTRVVVFCNGFYDVFDKRTEAADFTKKEILGARAAKLDDSDVSAKKALSGWDAGDYNAGYTCDGAGTLDVHFLHYGGTDGASVFGALVTFWSTRFFYKNSDVPVGSGYTAAGLFKDSNNVYHNGDIDDKRHHLGDGLSNAMKRWNEKDYYLEQADDGKDVVIKTMALFEGKEIEDPADDFTELGGKAHCDAALVKNKLGSWIARVIARFRESGYKDEGQSWGDPVNTLPALKDHGAVAAPAKLAFAHELGHASGLDDEYVYYISEVPGLIRYKQYYPGMPYLIDKPSLMSANRALRMRHYWGRVNWVNDEAANGKALHPFLAAKAFRLCFEPTGGKKYEFDLNNAKFRDIYKPAHQEDNVALDNEGKCNLYLYKLGEDEFCRAMKGGPYDGMLVVATKISVRFGAGALYPVPPAWSATTPYAKGACVEQGGKYYACVAPHPAKLAFANADWAEIDATADNWGWSANTNYDPKEWVDSRKYSCVVAHKSGTRPDTLWVEQGADKGAWKPGEAYVATDVIQDDGKTYVCLDGHTSAAGTTTADLTHWTPCPDRGPWTAQTDYARHDLVQDSGKTYVSGEQHKSSDAFATDEGAKWLEVTDRGAWATGTAYQDYDIVSHDAGKFMCETGHTSPSLSADPNAGKWLEAATDKGAYADGTDYAVSDYCNDTGKTCVCRVAHKAGSFEADVAAGRWVQPASRPWETVKGDWAGALKKDLTAMLEGADGKFFLSAAGDSPFKKTYVRFFPQWEVKNVGDGATAGTHFELEVTPDGSADFSATGSKIEVGSECDNATIIRFLYGKISDDVAGRGGQNLTDDLTKADFDKLKEWTDGKTGATFSVKDIA